MISSLESLIPYVVSIFHSFLTVAEAPNWPVLETLKETSTMPHMRKRFQSSLKRLNFIYNFFSPPIHNLLGLTSDPSR